MAVIIQNSQLDEAAIRGFSPDYRDWIYNALDCCVTHEVTSKVKAQMDNVATNTYEFSKALQAPIFEMSLRGVRIDLPRRDAVLQEYRDKIKKLDNALTRIVEEGLGAPNFNWRSPSQLQTLFYKVLGCTPIRKRNAQGRFVPTVNRDALERLQVYFHAEPICNYILALRDLDKKRQFLETELDPDQRIRTKFNIAGTKTGRLASTVSDFGTGTNVQNIDPSLRSTFIPDPGMKFANCDLEQADARNVGAICWNLFVDDLGPEKAGAYLDACESGDLHTQVCRMAWSHLPWTGDIKADRNIANQIAYRDMSYRDLAKRLGHGTNYLGTPPTMAKHTKVDVGIIREFQERYFAAFPCIKMWHNQVSHQLKFSSTITTLLGRRRVFFGRFNDDKVLREAVAYEPQSLTADEVDTGLLRIWEANRVQLLIQVHDSLLVQYRESEEAEILPWLLEAMRIEITLKRGRVFSVPVEAKVGWNWGDFDERKPNENPHGLIKWRGHDSRKRPAPTKHDPFSNILDKVAADI